MRALRAICWPPCAFEDVKEVAARPCHRPYTNQLTGHVFVNYNILLVYRNLVSSPDCHVLTPCFSCGEQSGDETNRNQHLQDYNKICVFSPDSSLLLTCTLALKLVHLIIERASRYPWVLLIGNSFFARNTPFSQTRSHNIT